LREQRKLRNSSSAEDFLGCTDKNIYFYSQSSRMGHVKPPFLLREYPRPIHSPLHTMLFKK
jgi:hypothetical protein